MELTKQHIISLLPKREMDANKGTFGKILVIAGSENYPGAAYLCCAAAYRVGTGLVTLVTKPFVETIISKKLPEVTFLSFNEVKDKSDSYDVLLVGPGVGREDETRRFIEGLINNKLPKTLIDGDGLNLLSKMENWWEKLNGEVVLTPHPGEMARLTDLSVNEIQANREEITKQFAKKWNKIVVLKGANTVIVSPAGEVGLSPFANPALATAGTGDVLSGIIAGLIAQGLKTFDAACCGVYIHGMAGEEIKQNMGDAGALASDLLPLLPGILKKLKQF